MGDRANVYIHEGERPGVYIYTHWAGSELPQMVERALMAQRAKNRLNDVSYLTRILIEELIADSGDYGSETGWGVSADVGDGADRIVDINVLPTGTQVQNIGWETEEEPEDWDDYCDCSWCYPDDDFEEDESHDDY